MRKFFVEAKKPSVNLKHTPEPAYQLRRYAWSAKLQAENEYAAPWLAGVDNSKRRLLCIALDDKDTTIRHAIIKGTERRIAARRAAAS